MSRKVSIVLSILPLILLTAVVFHFSLDIPYWDQWEFVPLLQKSYEGKLTFNDFWVPHNEHRPVFPRLIMLGLARLTNWNIRWELALNILLGIGIYTLPLLVILFVILIIATSLYRIKTIAKRYNELSQGEKSYEKLYYSGEVVKERMKFLKESNLSLFRE